MAKFRQPKNTIWWPVRVRLLDDNGTFDKDEFSAKFRRISKAERDVFTAASEEDISEMTSAEQKDYVKKFHDRIFANILDWKLENEDGSALEFNRENFEMVLDVPEYKNAIISAFNAVQSGGAAKN